MLCVGSTYTAVIGLDAFHLSGALLGWGGRAVPLMSEATALCGGGGWMASEHKVQEKCDHCAVRG